MKSLVGEPRLPLTGDALLEISKPGWTREKRSASVLATVWPSDTLSPLTMRTGSGPGENFPAIFLTRLNTCDIGVCTFSAETKDARDLRRASLRTRRALALASLYCPRKNSVLCRRYLPKARRRSVTACRHSSDHQGTGRRLVNPVV